MSKNEDYYNRPKGCEHKIGQFLIGIIVYILLIILCSCEKIPINNQLTVTDIDNNIYNIIAIGNQVWLKGNLKTTKLNDGTKIPYITYAPTWRTMTSPAYCYYDNDLNAYANTYGVLYNWYTINSGKLCPIGWHVPTYTDWQVLFNYLGGIHIAGGILKSTNTWASPNIGATDQVDFTALPGGFRDYTGEYLNLTDVGFWWSSTADVILTPWGDMSYNAYDILLHKSSASIYGTKHVDYPYSKIAGMSVRCLQN